MKQKDLCNSNQCNIIDTFGTFIFVLKPIYIFHYRCSQFLVEYGFIIYVCFLCMYYFDYFIFLLFLYIFNVESLSLEYIILISARIFFLLITLFPFVNISMREQWPLHNILMINCRLCYTVLLP